MYLKQRGTISILSGKLVKFVNPFTYLGSNISSTVSDVNMCVAKVWDAIDIRKFDLSDKIKQDFSKLLSCPYDYMDAPQR